MAHHFKGSLTSVSARLARAISSSSSEVSLIFFPSEPDVTVAQVVDDAYGPAGGGPKLCHCRQSPPPEVALLPCLSAAASSYWEYTSRITRFASLSISFCDAIAARGMQICLQDAAQPHSNASARHSSG